MANKKPLFYDGMSSAERLRSIAFVILAPLVLAAVLIAPLVWAYYSESDGRSQYKSESDYEYRERIRGEDEEFNKDCGFRPGC